MFTINETEQKRIDDICAAAELLFGENCIKDRRYLFSPSNGIGSNVEFEITLTNGSVIRKEVTDYDSW